MVHRTLLSQWKIFWLCRTSTRHRCQKRWLLYTVEKFPLWQVWGRGNKSSPNNFFIHNFNGALGAKIILELRFHKFSIFFNHKIWDCSCFSDCYILFFLGLPLSALYMQKLIILNMRDHSGSLEKEFLLILLQLFLRWRCGGYNYSKYKFTSHALSTIIDAIAFYVPMQRSIPLFPPALCLRE